jgi:uncharacterized spore protein YtfJ
VKGPLPAVMGTRLRSSRRNPEPSKPATVPPIVKVGSGGGSGGGGGGSSATGGGGAGVSPSPPPPHAVSAMQVKAMLAQRTNAFDVMNRSCDV